METKSNESDGRKKLTCETCNRTFISSIAFLRHQKRHQMAASSGFTCTVCKTDFLYDWERVSHMVRYHKLNGPLDCFVCRHSFRNYAEYRSHKRYCKTTLKCVGETTMSGQSVSGDKENVFAGNTDNIDCEYEGNDTSDSGRGASDQGETTLGCESDINKDSTDVPPLGKVKVKLSCGTILFVKDTMIKTSFVADDDDSVATIDEGHAGTESASLKNVSTDTVASSGKVQTSFGNAETSQGKKCNSSEDKSASSTITPGDRETDGTKKLSVGTESLSVITENSSVKTVNTILEVDIICTRCHKDVRELFTEDERKHVCNICRRTYVSSFQLSKHMAAHTATKFYRCHHCDKCFTETRYLQRHLIDTHRERYSICRFCCALFISRPGLTQHLKEKHPNQGRYNLSCLL
ncbi:transcription factor E4F1-like [Pecten maximus]|uniref:transcription factor E4F1-like n=1 Tax=Pecten maximus TaxID=6579 RepID=UPI0014584E0D|nr:transcription factor E4F1-like [Pecten maximus]